MNFKQSCLGGGFLLMLAAGQASAVELRVTVENLAPANGVTFSPLRVGFHSGVFDAFDEGQSAFLMGESDISTAPIVSIAESGSGTTWFPAFEAADPTATLGTVIADPAGPLTPGHTATNTFTIDPTINQYFTFAAMVVPSNDLFISNDSPTAFHLFDDDGNLLINQITQTGAQVWNAGSEQAIAENAAFLKIGTNSNRVNENGVVEFSLDEFATYDGLETAAGYIFDSSSITAGSEILRINFEVVPEPASLMGFAGLMGPLVFRRRRR